MPGIMVWLTCERCDYQANVSPGSSMRVFDNVADYMRANRLRKKPSLAENERIHQLVVYSVYQCPECAKIYETKESTAHDQSGHVDVRKGRSRCPRCHTPGRKLSDIGESVLRCPNCRHTLSVHEMGVWD